jgi:hypothetical protein
MREIIFIILAFEFDETGTAVVVPFDEENPEMWDAMHEELLYSSAHLTVKTEVN